MRLNTLKILILIFSANITNAKAQVLNKQNIFEQFEFWDNRDFEWYKENIPFFESPDSEIDRTYYYRWELITKHLVYGSPETGYTFTEFIDRPWWSGAYGAISCAAGHQLYEIRWFRNKRFFEDFANYWFYTPNAQPRNYSTWIADGIWQNYKVYYDGDFVAGLLPKLVENYKGWEQERYVPHEGMFAWDGMHDGMETNINSRQTPNWFSGAPGYRPSLNSYMWADAKAIEQIARLKGDKMLAKNFEEKATVIKTNFQSKCWDPQRDFFFHRYQNDEEGGIKANTLTYQTGKHAGSNHGREVLGYIPWYFNMLDPGYEKAWTFLMDTAYFFADRGPYTVEKNDPMFHISPNCCVWSGNSWPYATTQTIKAMANLLNNYKQDYVAKDDFLKFLKIYTLTHRKDGKPYIAEACHPVTGSWSGHDVPYHSEHYFHSGYIDLIIADLVGLIPHYNDSVTVKPLIPSAWDYFCLDGISYHGNQLTVLWDRDGQIYNKGAGLQILLNGEPIAQSDEIAKITAYVPNKPSAMKTPKYNLAVNNGAGYFPRAITSFPGIAYPFTYLNDGQYWYHVSPPNRWSTLGTNKKETPWCGIDFGNEKVIDELKVYFIDDDSLIKVPNSYYLEYWNGKKWQKAKNASYLPEKPKGRMANVIKIKPLKTSKVRVVMEPQQGVETGVSEFEAWGPELGSMQEYTSGIENIAFQSMAEITASYSSGAPEFDLKYLNDGVLNKSFLWSSHMSPNKQDTLTVDFGSIKSVHAAHLFLYEDAWEQKPPKNFSIQYLNAKNNEWENVVDLKRMPEQPAGNSLNLATFDEVKTSKIRIILKHKKEKNYSALYELEFFGNN